MAKKNRPKKSKALVVWAIVTVIVLLADCVGNYLVVGLPGSMNRLLDKPMAALGEAVDFKLSALYAFSAACIASLQIANFSASLSQKYGRIKVSSFPNLSLQ